MSELIINCHFVPVDIFDSFLNLVKDNYKVPVFAYQVSGEYSLIKNGILKNIINEDAVIESLISFKRAGASAIVTYFAEDVAKKLNKS